MTPMKLNRAQIRKLINALEVFKEVDPGITLPSILAFLYYVEEDGRAGNRHNVERRLGLSNATGSRATLYWGDFKKPRVPGVGFLTQIDDPEDRRYSIVSLTRGGIEFAHKLSEALSDDNIRPQ